MPALDAAARHSSLLQAVQRGQLMLSLERSLGRGFGQDLGLCQNTAITANVFPDLPAATTWGNLVKQLSRR